MAEPEPLWCVVANVRPEAYGNARSPGTKHFRAGALLWVVSAYWGDGFERGHVIGHHRVSKRLIAIVEETARLTNWRAKPVLSPALVRMMGDIPNGRAWESQAQCEQAARVLNVRFPPEPDLRGEIARRNHALHLLDHDEQGQALERMAAAALGRWTPQQRQADRVPPYEVFVLSDWLEDRGVPIAVHELVRTLDRRRVL